MARQPTSTNGSASRSSARDGDVGVDAELLAKIMQTLGGLEANVSAMRDDIADDRKNASESRGRLYDKMDRIEGEVVLVGQVAAMARDKADALGKTVTDEIKPETDAMKRMRLMGYGVIAAVGVIGALFGLSLATVGAGFLDWLRSIGQGGP